MIIQYVGVHKQRMYSTRRDTYLAFTANFLSKFGFDFARPSGLREGTDICCDFLYTVGKTVGM